jgi:pimeloyl-ACP methyl ester carboxylesterase
MAHAHVSRLCAAVLIISLPCVALSLRADAGGGPPAPDPIRSDWQSRLMRPGDDAVAVLNDIPHDPNLLGVRTAHVSTMEYPRSFVETVVPAGDGVLLSGMLAIYQDRRPRPGIVLVPGFTQTKDLRFVVELADMFSRNGWHVLTIDNRGQGGSRKTSGALISLGWKEADDVIGAVRYLRDRSGASSVSVVAFSMAGRSLIRAMTQDAGTAITAGVGVTTPLLVPRTMSPPRNDWKPSRYEKFLLDFLGAPSFHAYFDRAARSYGVELSEMLGHASADTLIAGVKQPLLMLYALDDFQSHIQIRAGRHDAGTFSLAYRDSVRDKPHIKTMIVDRGNHSGMLYLSDRHWFGLVTMNYLKQWQARDMEYVTTAVPAIDVLAEGELHGETARYRFVVRNHGTSALGPLDVHVQLPPRAKTDGCWVGFEGLAPCSIQGDRLRWTIPRLPGQKTTAGPFVVSASVAAVKPGPFNARFWVTTNEGTESMREEDAAGFPQAVTLDKR